MHPAVLEGLMLAAAVLANVLGFAWLALAMDVHWEQACGRAPYSPAVARLLRWAGTLALISSAVICLVVEHVSMASLMWVMSLAAAALVVTMTLTHKAAWLAWLVPGALRRG